MNSIKWIAGCAMLLLASCGLKEEVRLNANNSIDRNVELNLDKEAGAKLISMAAMAGQQQKVSLDSLSFVWAAVSDTLKKLVEKTPGATVAVTPWDTTSYTGKMNFHLPDLQSYNNFANSGLSLPAEANNSMPIGGLERQQLEWRGKDTLIIRLDNSKADDVYAGNKAEMDQALGMIKMMLGIDALVNYKASFYLPKAAKSVTGTGAALSADKKTVSIEKSLDTPNAAGLPDEIKVAF